MEVWCSLSLSSCPDALSCCPRRGGTCLAYGAYELCDGKRAGGLGLIQVTPAEALPLSWHQLGVGILDLRWINESSVLVATAAGDIDIYYVEDQTYGQVLPRGKTAGTLALSVDRTSGTTPALVAGSYADGSLAVADLAAQAWIWECSQAHEYEAWFTCFDTEEHSLISGGDDGYMRLWDWRLSPERQSCISACQAHKRMGVTAARPLDVYCFLSGGFDENLCVWDRRKLSVPLQSLRMPGGVWRIHRDDRAFLAACMYGQAAMLRFDDDGRLVLTARLEHNESGSLVYAASWVRIVGDETSCATASFYGKQLHFWRKADCHRCQIPNVHSA